MIRMSDHTVIIKITDTLKTDYPLSTSLSTDVMADPSYAILFRFLFFNFSSVLGRLLIYQYEKYYETSIYIKYQLLWKIFAVGCN